MRILERGLEVLVGHERHAARELGLRLRDEPVGNVRVVLDAVRNEAVRAEMSTAPASAVPIEAPSCVPVFCRPPTSPLCSSGTADTVTAPELGGHGAEPGARQQQRPGDDLRAGADVEQGHQEHEPGEQR